MKNQQQVEDEKIALIQMELGSATTAFGEEASSWSEKLAATYTHICKESNDTTTKQLGLLNQSISILHSLIGSVCSEIQHYLKEEREALTHSHERASQFASEEIDRLKRQNETLAKWIIDE